MSVEATRGSLCPAARLQRRSRLDLWAGSISICTRAESREQDKGFHRDCSESHVLRGVGDRRDVEMTIHRRRIHPASIQTPIRVRLDVCTTKNLRHCLARSRDQAVQGSLLLTRKLPTPTILRRHSTRPDEKCPHRYLRAHESHGPRTDPRPTHRQSTTAAKTSEATSRLLMALSTAKVHLLPIPSRSSTLLHLLSVQSAPAVSVEPEWPVIG